MKVWAEYIWIGGVENEKRVKTLRSKGRIVEALPPIGLKQLDKIPEWGFDGSSTNQATGSMSDVRLRPVYVVPDFRHIISNDDVLVLCETFTLDDAPHPTNTRRRLLEAVERHRDDEVWFGFEQEYTFYDEDGERPLRWPVGAGYPAPQGRYYCGVGCDEVYGEEIVEEHTRICLKSGLSLVGINAEVMPAQWEFQIGPLGAPEVADQLWLARWILYKIAAKHSVSVKLDPKPQSGDWNGAGCHANFSTVATRSPDGLEAIFRACERLELFHPQHIGVYGPFNDQRLTGEHETAPYTKFRYAPYDRGASVRIPISTMDKKCGYLEDRRPAANADPYEVCLALLETVCGEGFVPYREPDVTIL